MAPRVARFVVTVLMAASMDAMAADADLRTVGWRAQDFPDNSVVCHGRRLVGLPQSCFVGGGALLVRTGVGVDLPFFPRVYNEDWLFLHDLVQQLNIVKPPVQREYVAAGDVMFSGLVWQEGFADYRTQSQSRGAMVELVTLDEAEIKYSTVQNWYPGDEEGKGGIYNFVTKRAACRGRNRLP